METSASADSTNFMLPSFGGQREHRPYQAACSAGSGNFRMSLRGAVPLCAASTQRADFDPGGFPARDNPFLAARTEFRWYFRCVLTASPSVKPAPGARGRGEPRDSEQPERGAPDIQAVSLLR